MTRTTVFHIILALTLSGSLGTTSTGSPWQVKSGKCKIEGDCLESPNFPSDYNISDTCQVSVTEPGFIRSKHFETESNHDLLSVGTEKFSGSTGPVNLFVKPTDSIKWSSDSSTPAGGWKVCFTPQASNDSGFWRVSSGSCYVNGSCLTSPNYPGFYGMGEHCKASVTRDGILTSEAFRTESCCDHLIIAGVTYRGTEGPMNIYVDHTQDTLSWVSDYSNTDAGWKICFTPQATAPLLRQKSGNCEIQGSCVQSKGFPEPYPEDSSCSVEFRENGVLNADVFSTRQSIGGLLDRLTEKCLKADTSDVFMDNCSIDLVQALSQGFYFDSDLGLKNYDNKKCLQAQGRGQRLHMDSCTKANDKTWHFDGDHLKVAHDDSLCLTAPSDFSNSKAKKYPTMEPCNQHSDNQRWIWVGKEKTGDVLSVGKSEFSGLAGPKDADLVEGTTLSFKTNRRRSYVPGTYRGMPAPAWKVCAKPRSVIPWFMLLVLASQALIWGSMYAYHRYWKNHHNEVAIQFAVKTETETFATSLLKYFMPNGSVNNYRFRGMAEKQTKVSLKFEDLGLNLMDGRCVLKGVTGEFVASRMVAIMGPSGAGKTTFMNVLCGKATYGTMTGKVKVNGEDSDVRRLSSVMGFVPQDDVVHETLTVRENMIFAALLKNPPETPRSKIRDIVEDVLNVMQVGHIQNSIVGGVEQRGISGGQRKRVNIALELAGCPTLLFLDEPTSGLDATSSLTIIHSLKKMTELGMTIIMVIHQPRYSLFTLFDDVLLLGVGGHTVYLGPSLGAHDYFKGLGFEMPASENPADWFMDIISGEVDNKRIKDFNPKMLPNLWLENGKGVMPKTAPGKASAPDDDEKKRLKKELMILVEEEWYKHDKDESDSLDEKELESMFSLFCGDKAGQDVIDELLGRMGGTFSSTERYVRKKDFMEYVDGLLDLTAVDRKSLADPASFVVDLNQPLLDGLQRKRPNFCKQYRVVFCRRLVQVFRWNRRRFIDTGLVCACALIAGFMHRGKLRVDGTSLPQKLMICHMGLSLLTTVSVVKVFGADRAVFWRESASGLNVAAFFFARVTLDTCEVILQCVVFSLVYFIVASPWHPSIEFSMYFWPCLLVSLTSAGWGYFISTLVPPENATLGAVIFSLVFCGIFGDPSNMGNFISGPIGDCVTFFSITRWSVQMTFAKTIERATDMKMEVAGPLILLDQDYKKGTILGYGWDTSMEILLLQAILLRLAGYLGLKFRNRDKQV